MNIPDTLPESDPEFEKREGLRKSVKRLRILILGLVVAGYFCVWRLEAKLAYNDVLLLHLGAAALVSGGIGLRILSNLQTRISILERRGEVLSQSDFNREYERDKKIGGSLRGDLIIGAALVCVGVLFKWSYLTGTGFILLCLSLGAATRWRALVQWWSGDDDDDEDDEEEDPTEPPSDNSDVPAPTGNDSAH